MTRKNLFRIVGAIITLLIVSFGLFYVLMSIPNDFRNEAAAPKGDARQTFEKSVKFTGEKTAAQGVIVELEISPNWANFVIKDGNTTYDLYKWDNSGLDWAESFQVGDEVRFTYYGNSLGIIRTLGK